MEAHKNFTHVFEKINFSSNIMREFSDAKIDFIKVHKNIGEIKINMKLKKIASENAILDFKNQLKSAIPRINQVDLNIKYMLDETIKPYHVLTMYWNNMLHIIKGKSPICYKILEKAKWEIAEDNIVIYVNKNAKFLLCKRNINKEIQNILDSRFQLGLYVTFEYIEQAKEDKYKKLIKEKELISKAILEVETMERDVQPVAKVTNYKDTNYKGRKGRSSIKINPNIEGEIFKLSKEIKKDSEIIVCGEIFEFEKRETKSGKYLISFDMYDNSNSVSVKFFIKPENFTEEYNFIKKGSNVIVKGKVQFDEFSNELNIMAVEIGSSSCAVKRKDNAEEKRVELHLHTQMSQMDAINSAREYINRALEWGHKAIAITDHGVVQAFPEAMEASRGKPIKVIYGVEAYLIDDLGAVVQCPRDKTLDSIFTVFDIETTGLTKGKNKIIEIGAVKIENGVIIDKFSTFINPLESIPDEITKLTGINDDMVKDAPLEEEVLPKFLEFASDSILVAHNAGFDVGFITVGANKLGFEVNNTVLDTVELSRTLFPELSKHKLNIVAKHLGISLENHHRAVDDATATAEIFLKCVDILKENKVYTLQEINVYASKFIDKKKLKTNHSIILAKTQKGLKNLYELISKAHIDYFYRRPRIPKSEYINLREGLLIGTACEAGEFYKAVRDNKSDEFIRGLSEFYDYFEIQPIENNMYMVRNEIVKDVNELKEINKKIVTLGEKYNKPVVATCDVHFMEKEDEVYRRIIMSGDGFQDADFQPPLYFRTTEEMLNEFMYLGEEKAKEVVITNTNKIADMIEEIKPIPDETFPPVIEGAEEELYETTMNKAKELYGENLPQIVTDRLERELNSIIKNGFSVMYIIAKKLVSKSMEDGYLVGSRGSVGSSFAATMADITEVNPLPPHYLCSNCKYSDFNSEEVLAFVGASGCDMPDKPCPVCGEMLKKDGHDIPFETFLGFDGDKEPDIDLNFSGEYQLKAHQYTEVLFGKDNIFKAGTIGTIADKTAYGYVKKYLEEKGINIRMAESNRLKKGCTGIKRTTGQHPGGLMVLPAGLSIYDFCPVQRPANDMKSNVTTTHFDYHSISGRLLKLDLLGHDVPTIIRMIHDITGIDPQTVDLGDKAVMSLFTSPNALGVTEEQINCKTGSLGLPEFGTGFVRQMLIDTQPNSFSELVRISGLSHGTGVWVGNAQDIIKEKVATLKEIIPTRDDIMVYLINKGVEKKTAFKIMENVRKGKGLKDDEVEIMKVANIPDWYIDSCKRIEYMFPKGHAVAYVMMTVRIGYFKIYYPYSFYAATFSVKAEDFNYETMCSGKEVARQCLEKIIAMGNDAAVKEKNSLTILELVLEMYERGLKFVPLDIYKADAFKFTVTEDGLMPPLCSIQGLGSSVAQNIVDSRKDGEFFTIEEFRERTKTNKTVIELLKRNNIFKGIPETNQLSLFD